MNRFGGSKTHRLGENTQSGIQIKYLIILPTTNSEDKVGY